jgi:2'-5' RNA ligase superfamily
MEKIYILTAEMDEESFVWLDGLRREHFPSERNLLQAHLTLFHRLSVAQVDGSSLPKMPSAPLALRFDRLAFLGFGVALHVQSGELERLRNEIRNAAGGEFSRQDSQPWKPHVTIQNKVSAESARKLHRLLQEQFSERVGAATGLLVWEYLGGPWKLQKRIAFC